MNPIIKDSLALNKPQTEAIASGVSYGKQITGVWIEEVVPIDDHYRIYFSYIKEGIEIVRSSVTATFCINDFGVANFQLKE